MNQSLSQQLKNCIGRQIFEGKLSVSPYFLHRYQNNNKAGMFLVDKLSLNILNVYNSIIFSPNMKFEVSISHENKEKNDDVLVSMIIIT